MCMQCLWKPEEGVGPLELELVVVWVLGIESSLKELSMLLATKSPLQRPKV